MGRILAIDFGTKRIGIATTDPSQLIARALVTTSQTEVWNVLDDFLAGEDVETIVVGEPLREDGSKSKIHHLVVGFARKLANRYPQVSVVLFDERYTSKEAERIIRQSGVGQKKRREKGIIDKISAALILESYMKEKKGW